MQEHARIVQIDDRSTSVQKLLEQTARDIGADALIYYRLDPCNARMEVCRAVHLPVDSGHLSGRICHDDFILAGKPTSFHADLSETDFWESDPDLKRHAWHSYMAAAVKEQDRTIGSLAAFCRLPHRFQIEQLGLLKTAADLIALQDECSLLHEQLRALLRRERIVSAICAQVDTSLTVEDCLQRCLGLIGDEYACDAVSLYFCNEVPLNSALAARWSAPERRSIALDAHVGAILSLPVVVGQLAENGFFCCDAAQEDMKGHLRDTLRAVKTATLALLTYDSAHLGRIVCAIQDCQARTWNPADLNILAMLVRVIARGLRADTTPRHIEEIDAEIVQSPPAAYSIDLTNRRFISISEPMCQATGYSREELAGMDPGDLMMPEGRNVFNQRLADIAMGRPVSRNVEFQMRTKSGVLEWGHFHIRHLYVAGGISVANVVAHIITRQKKNQEELAKYGRALEALVEARTSELSESNRQLRKEIDRHTQTAAELRKQSERLTEMNTAMRVLLDKRNEERIRSEENIRLTLKELIEPYLLRLESSGLGPNQRQLLDLIRLNLEEVVGSSLPEVPSAYLYFSPNELQIVNLIRQGKSTKEMAGLLNISSRTVEAYRNNVRKKLGLKNRKVNLRTFLSSFK